MEEYKYKWQMFVGGGLMLLLICTIFLPRMSISGTKYVDMAVAVNEYALDKDSDKAEDAGADDIVEDYGVGGDNRDERISEYDDEIDNKTGEYGHISTLFLGAWMFWVEDTLYFDGVNYKKGKKIENSGVQERFKLIGLFLYIPVIMAFCVIVHSFAKRKTDAIAIVVTGCVTIVSELLYRYASPTLIWSAVKEYVESFSMIDKKLLDISGVGSRTVGEIWGRFGSITWIINISIGGVLVLLGILFLTVFRPKRETDEGDEKFMQYYENVFSGMKLNGRRMDDLEESGKSMYVTEQKVYPKPIQQTKTQAVHINTVSGGLITGVEGEHAGLEIPIKPGQNIVIGRDPKLCTLIIRYEKISRKHCLIRYDEENKRYLVRDFSSNGTMVIGGKNISKKGYTPVYPGSMIMLGSEHDTFLFG